MAVDFPASPTTGQKFLSGNFLYTYDGVKWVASAANKARDFNYLVNPSFAMAVETGGATGTADGYYWADQWRILATSAAVACANSGRFNAATNYNSPMRARTTCTVVLGTVGAGDYHCFYQPLEGNRVMPFAWGTSYAKQVIIRLSLKAPTGTYGVSLRNAAANRSCVFALVVAAGQNNILTEYTLVVPPDTTGTWNKDSTASLSFTVSVVCGTTFQTATLGSWQNGNFLGPNTSTNGFSSTSNVFDFCDPGLYLDYDNTGLAPPFEIRSEVDSALESLRYWQKIFSGWGVAGSATIAARVGGPLLAPMRIAPTLTLQGSPTLYDGTVNNAGTIQTPYSTKSFWEIDFNATGITVGRPIIMIGSSPSTAVIANARM